MRKINPGGIDGPLKEQGAVLIVRFSKPRPSVHCSMSSLPTKRCTGQALTHIRRSRSLAFYPLQHIIPYPLEPPLLKKTPRDFATSWDSNNVQRASTGRSAPRNSRRSSGSGRTLKRPVALATTATTPAENAMGSTGDGVAGGSGAGGSRGKVWGVRPSIARWRRKSAKMLAAVGTTDESVAH